MLTTLYTNDSLKLVTVKQDILRISVNSTACASKSPRLAVQRTSKSTTMDDKKNEDYSVKVPEHEMRNFSGRSSPASAREPFLSSKPSGRAGGFLPSNITNSPPISILAYCLASISMTVTNKYCVSGANFNMNFFYLAIQVCYSRHIHEMHGGLTML